MKASLFPIESHAIHHLKIPYTLEGEGSAKRFRDLMGEELEKVRTTIAPEMEFVIRDEYVELEVPMGRDGAHLRLNIIKAIHNVEVD